MRGGFSDPGGVQVAMGVTGPRAPKIDDRAPRAGTSMSSGTSGTRFTQPPVATPAIRAAMSEQVVLVERDVVAWGGRHRQVVRNRARRSRASSMRSMPVA